MRRLVGIGNGSTVVHVSNDTARTPHWGPRVAFMGDTHGSTRRVLDVIDHVSGLDCHQIVSVGDFGWFPHLRAGAEFINAIDVAATDAGVLLSFIGGNHDNWEDLTERSADGEPDDDGFVIVGTSLRYIPRPHRWEWAGVRFGALGGAWSIDHRRRTPFINWWRNEEPSLEDTEKLCEGGSFDVGVFHDAPWEIDLSSAAWDGDDSGGANTRRLIDAVCGHCKPSQVFHGHWHLRHTTLLESGCRVDGLSHESFAIESQVAVLDLNTGDVSPTSMNHMPLRGEPT